MSVSEDSLSSRLSSANSAKMETFHSSQSQCCCCVVAVLVSFGGVIMTSIGVCLILNYGMINIDNILPPELQNAEGKKIIGIILICFGITGIIISSLVSILFFTICHAPQSPQTIAPMYYDTRMKNSSAFLVDRSAASGVKSSRPRGVSGATPSTSTPRKGYNTKKKKMHPQILESVSEDPTQTCPNPLPILQINGASTNGVMIPMRDVSLGSFRSQNSPCTLGENHLQNGATPSIDIATIQVSQMEKTESEIYSSKL